MTVVGASQRNCNVLFFATMYHYTTSVSLEQMCSFGLKHVDSEIPFFHT